MVEQPGHKVVVGVGVDIGGSGVRATSFARDAGGRLAALASHELRRESRGGAADLVELVAACLTELDRRSAGRDRVRLPLGVAAPGVKTADGRGIERARFVAPAPLLLDELQQRLTKLTAFELVGPARLASDAFAAVVGDTLVQDGLLLGVSEALFVGPGSGVAEAVLEAGAPRRVRGPRLAELPPTEQDGAFADLEAEVSLRGHVERWSALFPDAPPLEVAAGEGDTGALATLERLARALARVFEVRSDELAALRRGGAPPALLVRTRRGTFFANAAVHELVAPLLRAAAERSGARLVLPARPAVPHAACAGALELAFCDWNPAASS